MLDVLDRALALRRAPLFATLPPESVWPLAELCAEVTLLAGEALMREGERGDALYVIVRGRLAVARAGCALAELGEGACVGELAAIDPEPRSATVTALERSALVRLERDDLLDALGDHPELALALAQVLAVRLRG